MTARDVRLATDRQSLSSTAYGRRERPIPHSNCPAWKTRPRAAAARAGTALRGPPSAGMTFGFVRSGQQGGSLLPGSLRATNTPTYDEAEWRGRELHPRSPGYGPGDLLLV